jgi:hypothetical protein
VKATNKPKIAAKAKDDIERRNMKLLLCSIFMLIFIVLLLGLPGPDVLSAKAQ